MKKHYLLPLLLIIVLLLLSACKGISPYVPEPGATDENENKVTGKIMMPYCCLLSEETESSARQDVGKYSGYDCYDETDTWRPAPGASVELREADRCTVKYKTTTDNNGNYVFTDVKPGMYILTTYCPTNDGYFLKDVIEKEEEQALDAGIPDCDSTSLALVIEYINDVYCHCLPLCPCFNEDWSTEYKLITEIARSTQVNMEVDIPAILAHSNFGDLCEDNDDLVDLVCEKLQSCCISPGATDGDGCNDCPDGETYTLTLQVSPGGSGTTTGSGTYDEGSTANISATPGNCWQFENWTIDLGTPGSVFKPNQVNTQVLMNGDVTLTANFQESKPVADAGGPYGPIKVCKGAFALIDLEGNGSGTGTISYSWDLDNDGQFGDSTNKNPQDVSFGAGSHTVTLKVTDDCGTTTDTATITVNEYSNPVAIVNDLCYQLDCEPTITAALSGNASGGKAPYTYAWDLDNDGEYDDDPLTQNVFSEGVYNISLKVTDACGKTDTDTAVITVHPLCDLPEKLVVNDSENYVDDDFASEDDYYLRVKFNTGSGDIDTGWYYGWCAFESLTIGPPTNGQDVNVYCTLDNSLADYWPKINWIINNRNGYTRNEVQDVIWHYINGKSISGDAVNLFNAAESHDDFCPDIGQKYAVLLTRRDIDNSLYQGVYKSVEPREEQPILIEVTRVNHCLD